MGLFDKFSKAVSEAAISAGTSATTSVAIKKIEMELTDLNNKYDECYLIIGKRIAEFIRNGNEIDDARVKGAFERISQFDIKKSELESRIKELKGDKILAIDAKKLVEVEEDAENEIAKCKELLDMGVDTQEEYDRKVATHRNKVGNYKKLDAIDKALAKKLISVDDYMAKKAAILGQNVVE
jgi:hypothetical protein